MSIRRSPTPLFVVALLVAGCTPDTFEITLPSTSGGGSSTGAVTTGSASGTSGTSVDTTVAPGSSSGTTSMGSSDSTGECVPTGDDWWDLDWARRRRIEIDPSVLTGVQQDFPVLVRLAADGLGATWSERGGDDIRVRAEDQGVPLDFDVDDADADGELALWLRMPTIDAAGAPLVAWLYYDQPEAASGSNPDAVWNDYISVHHLGSDLRDSVGNGHGSSQWEPELCDGRDDCEPLIGGARRFVPELLHEVVYDDHQAYDLGHDRFDPSLSFTVSLWMRSSTFGEHPWGALIAKGDDVWRIHVTGLPAEPENDDRISIGLDCWSGWSGQQCDTLEGVDGLGNYNLYPTVTELPTNLGDNAWHQVVGVFEAVGMPAMPPPEYVPEVQARIYVDGELAVQSAVMAGFLLPEDDQPVRLGHNINTSNRWGGVLDEVRISIGARSAEAIASDHATVTSEHVLVGPEEQRCP